MPYPHTYFTCVVKKTRKRYIAKLVVTEKEERRDMVQIVRNFISYVSEFLQHTFTQETKARKMPRGKIKEIVKIIPNS